MKFNHLVEVDYSERKIKIYRVFDTGEKMIYTSVEIPPDINQFDEATFKKYALNFGEVMLIDMTIVRDAFKILE